MATVVALLAGCASLPADRGLSEINPLLAARGGPAVAPPDDSGSAELRESLRGRPLSLADAQALAYAGNPRMREHYAALGLAGSEVLAAARLANPKLSLGWLDVSSGGSQWTLGLAQPFTSLLLMRSRRQLAAEGALQAQLQTGDAILQLGAEVEEAWWQLVAAGQQAALSAQIARAARLSAELAQRYAEAGNLAALPLNLERAAAAQAELEWLQAQAAVADARSALATLMGLRPDDADWQSPEQLPLPQGEIEELPVLLQRAQSQRLDLAAAEQQVTALQRRLGIARSTRALGETTLGLEREREPDGTRKFGPTMELELPLWNQNQSGLLRGLSELEIAEATQRRLSIAAANEIARAREQWQLKETALRVHREQLLPAREQALQRMQERVNFMFEGPFELLRSRQELSAAYRAYVAALRDWWLARAALARATGGLPTPPATEDTVAKPEVEAEPAPSVEDDPHAHHHH
jgi:cobalt-zinc-cadmium efflux system outer membrane protein